MFFLNAIQTWRGSDVPPYRAQSNKFRNRLPRTPADPLRLRRLLKLSHVCRCKCLSNLTRCRAPQIPFARQAGWKHTLRERGGSVPVLNARPPSSCTLLCREASTPIRSPRIPVGSIMGYAGRRKLKRCVVPLGRRTDWPSYRLGPSPKQRFDRQALRDRYDAKSVRDRYDAKRWLFVGSPVVPMSLAVSAVIGTTQNVGFSGFYRRTDWPSYRSRACSFLARAGLALLTLLLRGLGGWGGSGPVARGPAPFEAPGPWGDAGGAKLGPSRARPSQGKPLKRTFIATPRNESRVASE